MCDEKVVTQSKLVLSLLNLKHFYQTFCIQISSKIVNLFY